MKCELKIRHIPRFEIVNNISSRPQEYKCSCFILGLLAFCKQSFTVRYKFKYYVVEVDMQGFTIKLSRFFIISKRVHRIKGLYDQPRETARKTLKVEEKSPCCSKHDLKKYAYNPKKMCNT